MLKEFKEFAVKGNVLDLAVAVVMPMFLHRKFQNHLRKFYCFKKSEIY